MLQVVVVRHGKPQVANDRHTIVTRMIPAAADYARVSQQELQASLRDVRGATIITLSALTVPAYRKTGCPFKNNIQKFARVNGFLNFDYQRSVNNQREREDKPANFESMPRTWGTHLNNTPFISHVCANGEQKLYLKFKVQHNLSVAYYTLDGHPLSEAEVEPFLSDKEKAYRQGLNKDVIERDYTVSNLVTIHFNGMGYIIQ